MHIYSRRKFLKISGASVGAAASATAVTAAASGLIRKQNASAFGIQQIPIYCDICFWKCGAIAYVKDGALWKIEGNPWIPSAAEGCAQEAPAVSAPITIRTGCGRLSCAGAYAVMRNGSL